MWSWGKSKVSGLVLPLCLLTSPWGHDWTVFLQDDGEHSVDIEELEKQIEKTCKVKAVSERQHLEFLTLIRDYIWKSSKGKNNDM